MPPLRRFGGVGAIVLLVGLGLVVNCGIASALTSVLGLSLGLRRLGYVEHEFVVRNESGETLRDVRLHGADGDVLADIPELPHGGVERVEFDRSPPFLLRVEFRAADGRHSYPDVHYVDDDEWGDRDVTIRPGPVVFGRSGLREPVRESPR